MRRLIDDDCHAVDGLLGDLVSAVGGSHVSELLNAARLMKSHVALAHTRASRLSASVGTRRT